MEDTYLHHLYSGWGWLLWIGFWFLLFSSFGNWGYTYRVHRKHREGHHKTALQIIDERYARGDIGREEFLKMRNEISPNDRENMTASRAIKVPPEKEPI